MSPQKVQDARGRPVTGITEKGVMVRFRAEPWLIEELTYACQVVGCSKSEAIRQGILLWLQKVKQHYY